MGDEETGDGSLSPFSENLANCQIKETENRPLSPTCLLFYYKLNDTQTHRCYIRSSKKQKGQQVRKGKAMLQIHTNEMKNTKNTYRLFDLQGTNMPTAGDAEWLICVCLIKNGSSGFWDREPHREP